MFARCEVSSLGGPWAVVFPKDRVWSKGDKCLKTGSLVSKSDRHEVRTSLFSGALLRRMPWDLSRAEAIGSCSLGTCPAIFSRTSPIDLGKRYSPVAATWLEIGPHNSADKVAWKPSRGEAKWLPVTWKLWVPIPEEGSISHLLFVLGLCYPVPAPHSYSTL